MLMTNDGVIDWLNSVPRTYYCHDENGAFTSEKCYFGDGETLVNRSSLIGDYAYCGGNNHACSNTFLGGYRTKDYDPRWRGWYKSVRARQKESWSAPYAFFTGLDVGITFAKPIYSTQEEGGDEIRVFHGVVAVDLSFALISRFLQQAYSRTSISVVIFEYEEPSYIVGTSTGSQATKKVSLTEGSKNEPCSPDATQDECMAVRVPVSELTGHPMDSVLVRAYFKLQEKNFPDGELLTVTATEDDGVDPGIYVVHSWKWEQNETDIKWRILVTMPSTVAVDTTIEKGNKPLFGIICFIGSLGFCTCLAAFSAMCVNRNEPAVRCADSFLTEAFILGCVLLNTSTFTLLGPNTDSLCMLRIWIFHFFFASALSVLLIKVWRIHKLFEGAQGFRQVQITHRKAATKTLPIVVIQVIILSVFSVVDPPKGSTVVETVEGIVMEQSICLPETNAFFATQLAYDASLVVFGCILSYLTRNMDPRFGEAKQLLAVMYNIAFIGTVIVIIVHTMDVRETSKIVFKAVGIFWGSVFSTSAFVLPRLLAVRDEKRARAIRNTSS